MYSKNISDVIEHLSSAAYQIRLGDASQPRKAQRGEHLDDDRMPRLHAAGHLQRVGCREEVDEKRKDTGGERPEPKQDATKSLAVNWAISSVLRTLLTFSSYNAQSVVLLTPENRANHDYSIQNGIPNRVSRTPVRRSRCSAASA